MTWNQLSFWKKSLIISTVVGVLSYIQRVSGSIIRRGEQPLTVDYVYSALSGHFIDLLSVFLLLLITFSIIYWFVNDVKSKEGFRNWFFSRTSWKSGAMLGAFISLIIPLAGLTLNLIVSYPLNKIIPNKLIADISLLPASLITGIFTGKFLPRQYTGEWSELFIISVPFSILFYAVLGAIVGFIIQKTKK